MKGNGARQGPLEQFLRAMDSMRFAVILLIVLTVVSLIGALLPQFPPQGYQGSLEALYLEKYGTLLGGLFTLLGFHHLFTAWWYYLLLTLLCLNITVCSFRRLGRIIALVRREHYLEHERDYTDQPEHAVFSLELPAVEAAERATLRLRKAGYAVRERAEGEGSRRLYAKRGQYSQFGPFLSHIGIVVVILGAAVSYLMSFEHFQWVARGEVIEVPEISYLARLSFQAQLIGWRLSRAFGLERSPGPVAVG